MNDEYSLLSPFIQKYIYNHGWQELRDIQIRAIKVILKSPYHLLISSGTASGKTEAAFFPILTELERNPSSSIGILYIGPLKALINDQFERLEGLLQNSGIPLWHWHGEVSSSEKKQAMKHPSGVMQITPESLESLIMHYPEAIKRLFSDLRFVIIDEVHTFMGQERGLQVLCLLKRLNNLAGCNPRRVGLSATLSAYQDAKQWLKEGTETEVSLARSTSSPERILRVHYHHFDEEDAADQKYAFYHQIYRASYGTNAIIFANSRKCVELITREMKQIAENNGENASVFQAHHSSLSAVLRREAESSLKDVNKKTVAIATTTLELGIDIGDLDQVLQIGSPNACSSYVQRLGRSGRRGKATIMQFFSYEDDVGDDASIPARMPWELLKLIAIIELYRTSGWIEPFSTPKKPFSLLYQQTMSILYCSGGMKSGKLAEELLAMPSFSGITKQELKEFLLHLLEIGHLERTSDNLLIVGLSNEKAVNHYSFLAIFDEKPVYHVRIGTKEIGMVENFSTASGYLALGGKSWKVVHIDEAKKVIDVVPADNVGKITKWHGAGIPIHTAIIKKMREILTSSEDYPYLDASARNRLKSARMLAKKYKIGTSLVFTQNGVHFILPWIGTREMNTLSRELRFVIGSKYQLSLIYSGTYYIAVKSPLSSQLLEQELQNLRENPCNPYMLVDPNEEVYHGKYSGYISQNLRITEYVEDVLCQDFMYG